MIKTRKLHRYGYHSDFVSGSTFLLQHIVTSRRGEPGEDWGDPHTPQIFSVGSPVPKVRWRCGSWEGRPLGRIHNLDQEEAAPRVFVKDHDDEGPVEVHGERLRLRLSGDSSGGSCLHAVLIELQHSFMDHLLGWTKG